MQAGGDRAKIVPMAGELAHSTAVEMDAYVSEALAESIEQLHFYTYNPEVQNTVWDSVKRAFKAGPIPVVPDEETV
jgi:hypothetical protein